MKTVTYTIPNINCGHCVHTIQAELAEIKGVLTVKADIQSKKVEINFESPADEAKIKTRLVEINYPSIS
jgi:copper chaperone